MTYLLDTNAWIRYMRDRNSSVARRLATIPPGDVALCAVVAGELFHGAYRSNQRANNLALISLLLRTFQSFPFDDRSAEVYGRIRAELEAAGTPIGPNDLQIAAIALANGLTLVTHNTAEFARVQGLPIEDWEASAP